MTELLTIMTIILLSGWARSGKDVVASILVNKFGFRRLAFADALKEEVAAETGLPLTLFHSDQKDTVIPSLSKTPRQLLLEHALASRERDPDIYSRKVAAVARSHDKIVISDWRYQREYSFLRSAIPGTILCYRVTRKGVIPSLDPSEHDLDTQSMDAHITNDRSLEMLDAAVSELFQTAILFQPGS